MVTPMLAVPPPGAPDLQVLSQALEACAVGVVIADGCLDDHPIVYVNPAFEALSGYAAEEILGRNCRFLQGDERDQSGVGEIREAIAQACGAKVTLRNYRKDGSAFDNELTLSPIHDASGILTHYVGFQNDVTVREDARRQLTSTLERVTDGFISFDEDLNCTYTNAAAASIVGMRPDELVGHNLLTALPEYTDSAVFQAVLRARATGTSQAAMSYLEPLGRWIEVAVYPSTDGIFVFTRDVTQQQKSQEAQRASEERFTRIFETVPTAIVVSHVDTGHFIDVNPEFLRLSGYSRNEVIGHSALELNLWADPREQAEVWDTLKIHGRVHDRAIQFRVKSGEVRDTVTSAVLITIGRETCVATLVHDVTAVKLAQRIVTESEQRYRQIATELQRTLDLSLDLITSSDAEGRFVTMSAACQRMLGYAPEELIGRSFLEFVHPDDLARTQAEAANLALNHTTTVFRNRYLHRDGRTVWIEWNTVALPGDPLRHCVARDITERRAAEEHQAFLAAIVEASRDAVIGVNLDGTIRSWNAGAEELYGYTVPEAVGQPMTLITPPELLTQTEGIFRRVSQGERIEAFESVRMARDGRRIPVIATDSAIRDAAGEVIGVAKVTRDISALQAAEKKVHTLNEELRQQLRHITGLREIDQAIASGGDPTVTLELILDNICQQLGADAATALILSPHSLTLDYAATRGLCASGLQDAAARLNDGPAGRVALSRQPLTVPDLRREPPTPAWQTLAEREELRSYHAAPIIARGQVLGVIEVLHQHPFVPSPPWLETIETLVGQAAVAVEDAQLHAELERKNLELRLAYDETIEGWARALDLRDRETEGHSRRVTEMTVELCRQLGIPAEGLVDVRRGALLHDIGKMGVPDAILLKPGKLTDDEWVEMKKHPGHAVDLLSPIKFLRPALDIPQYHHEKWDGSGYPLGLSGRAIPLPARAFAVVDVYDALTSDRPYRGAWSRERALEHIRSGAGTHFDPQTVETFLQMLQQNES